MIIRGTDGGVFFYHRPMARRVSPRERCNRYCIGQDQWKPSGKCRPVCCMMNTVKFSLGDWRPRMPVRCPDRSSVNGKTAVALFFWVSQCSPSLRFKLFLEPHALRDQSSVDPRLPPIPVREPVYRRSRELTTFSSSHVAWKEASSPHRRFPILHVGIRKGADHP